MRKAKKLALLLLSLVLLIGTFTVLAIAEEAPQTATVVYPDGTTAEVAVGESLLNDSFKTEGEAKLYYGAENTLFKATEDWTFTIDGEAAELEGATVPESAAGKTIAFGGFAKVYYVTEEKISASADATTVYHLVDNVDKYMSASNTGDRGDGTNTGAHSREVLGNKATHSVKIYLYEDVITSQFNMFMMPSERQHNGVPTYLDLNGHNVTNNYTGSTTEIKGTKIYIYSSKPGANWYQPKTTSSAFYASDDGTPYLGNNGSGGPYADNISFHTNNLFHGHWGGGAYIYGGHYYMCDGATSSYLAQISRRVYGMSNASFYVKSGTAIFGDPAAHDGSGVVNGGVTITNCKFYSDGASPILKGSLSAVLSFSGCEFYGITIPEDATTVSIKAGSTYTSNEAITYQTAKFFNGKSAYYLASDLEKAQAFVESLPFAKEVIGPHEVLTNEGKTMHYIYDPIIKIVYDDSFNAVQSDFGEQVKIYFTTTDTTGTKYHTTNTAHSYINSDNIKKTTTVTLYEDVVSTSFSIGTDSSGYTMKLNLNGHNVTIQNRISTSYGVMYIYSSKPGANFISGASNGMIFANNSSVVYLGDDASGKYVDNISFHTPIVTKFNHGSGLSILGGHYYQTKADVAFVDITRRVGKIQNATFYLAPGTQAAFAADVTFSGAAVEDNSVSNGTNAINNCTFYSADGDTSVLYSTIAAAPKFTNCKFYGVNTTVSGGSGTLTADGTNTVDTAAIVYKTVTWFDGSITNYYPKDLEAAKFFVESHPLSAPIPYTFPSEDGRTIFYVADPTVTITFDDDLNAVITQDGESYKVAFTYTVGSNATQYAPDLGSDEENGASFFALLNDQANVKIVMYTDILLTSGVRFGTMVDTTDPKNKPTQRPAYVGPGKGTSTAYTEIDWDLNGYTVTVSADAKPIAMTAWLESQGAQTISVLHYPGYAKFKLYSSVAGGEYINNSAHPIFGINKYADTSYILGTSDPAINGGDNLTIVSNGPITAAYETSETGPFGYNLSINGGTYVSSYSGTAFSIGRIATIQNANILTTGNAYTVIANHFWSDTSLTVKNTVLIATASKTQMIQSGTYTGASGNGKKHTIALENVTFGGGTLSLSYSGATFSVTGDFKASNAEALALAYPEAPAGKTAAYSSVTVYGEIAKVLGYYENPSVVTVQNAKTGTTEIWLVGSVHVFDDTITEADKIKNVAGVNYHVVDAAWVSRVDGAIVENVCDASHADKIVVLAIEGDNQPLYFTRDVAGVITYYYGDAAAAGTSLRTLLGTLGKTGSTITLYSDVTISHNAVVQVTMSGVTHKMDLNGYKLTVNNPNASYAFKFSDGSMYVYSSVANGTIDASAANTLLMTDSSGNVYMGELSSSGTDYGKNLTVLCKVLFIRLYSNNAYFYGGTYIQPSNVSAPTFIAIDEGSLPAFRNSTFIVNSLTDSFIRDVKGTYTNCTFIAKEATDLVKIGKSNPGAAFNGCYFYNVIPNVVADATVTYNNCFFDTASMTAQNGGYIAFIASPVSLTVNGEDYTFKARFATAEEAALVDWGFGMQEYWVIGETATHKNEIIDDLFGYTFEALKVTDGENVAKATLVAIHPNAMQMSLTLHSYIGLNLMLNPAALEKATVTLNGETYVLANLEKVNGIYVITASIAPNKAAESIELSIQINDHTHTIPVGIGAYAKAVLGNEAYANAHDMTYAMVEYVRAMNPGAGFLDGVELEGYKAKEMPASGVASGASGCQIAFCLDNTIAIAVSGAGESIVLKLPSGRVLENPAVVDGVALFDALAVNELAATFEVVIGEASYTYSLVDYYYAIDSAESLDENQKDFYVSVIEALYSYSQYAFEYARDYK